MPKHCNDGDVIAHIGFPKTGTTSLQDELNRYPRYLGKHPELDSAVIHTFRRDLGVLSGWHFRKRWRRAHRARHQLRCVGSGAIISDEDLSLRGPALAGGAHFISAPFVKRSGRIAERIQEMPVLMALRRGDGMFSRVGRVLVTIRRQWDWLPSLYAERSKRNIFAGQRDFEARVQHFLKHDAWYLEYDRWLFEFERCLGESNVLILPVEAMWTPDYCRALAEFLNLDPRIMASGVAERRNAFNALSSSRGGWLLRPIMPYRLRHRWRSSDADRRNSETIFMPQWLVAMVRERYESSNRKLKARCHFSLEHYGY